MKDLGARYDLLRLLVVREVRLRYARTVLGVAWAVFHPLSMMLVFTALNFSRLVPEGSDYAGVPYPAFAFVGLIFWNHFAQSLISGTNSLPIARDMLHKSKFPAQLLPVSRILAWLLDLGIGFVLFLVMVPLVDGTLHMTALLVPLVFLVQLVFTIGLVLFLSALNLFFRDVQYLLQVAVLLLMFASNVVYPLEGVHEAAGKVLALNPVVSYLSAYRELILLGTIPSLDSMMPGLVGAGLALLVGAFYFQRVAPRFAEEV